MLQLHEQPARAIAGAVRRLAGKDEAAAGGRTALRNWLEMLADAQLLVVPG